MWEKNRHMWCWNCAMCGWNHQMWEKIKGTTKCEKITVTYDVGTAQCEDGINKCEKKSKGTTKCEKKIVTCNVGTAQCDDGITKCEKKK